MSAVGGRASPIAQLVERVAVNRKVAGSNPAGREASRFASHLTPCYLKHHSGNTTLLYFTSQHMNQNSNSLTLVAYAHTHTLQQLAPVCLSLYPRDIFGTHQYTIYIVEFESHMPPLTQ